MPQQGTSWRCRCENPCSTSAYGRSVYAYPHADKRLYPGMICDTPEWAALYAKRVAVERSIASFKAVLSLERRKTFITSTTKADLFLAGIVQLLCVVLADRLHDCKLARRVRKLVV
nr:transposase [Ruthenibacterium lactatiformans]